VRRSRSLSYFKSGVERTFFLFFYVVGNLAQLLRKFNSDPR
jgi:hypothetical protein